MGVGGSKDPYDSCAAHIASLRACKAGLGLGPRECYSPNYQGECDKLEQELKSCIAHCVCARAAATFYDGTKPRAARVAANKQLQACLAKNKTAQKLMGCTKRQ